MKSKRVTLAWFILAVIPPTCFAAEDAASPPNIVFIIADDLWFDLLGCNGHPQMKTPHIDRLAAEGANFTNCFATTSLCSPSRASFLTGLYAHNHRIVNNDAQGLDVVSHRLMTFPRILREAAGYHTAFIGKWHMGFDDTRRPGFDHWIRFKGQGPFIAPVVNINGERRQTRGYLTDMITQWGEEYLAQDFDRPFCLFLSHEAVHAPFLPAARHEQLYTDVELDLPEVSPDALQGKLALTRTLPESSGPNWFNLPDASPEPGEPRRHIVMDFDRDPDEPEARWPVGRFARTKRFKIRRPWSGISSDASRRWMRASAASTNCSGAGECSTRRL